MRTTWIRGPTIILAFCLFLCAGTAAYGEAIEVFPNGLRVFGRDLSLPGSEAEYVKALGTPARDLPPSGDQYSNRVLQWLDIGIVAFLRPGTSGIHAIELLIGEQGYWEGLLVQGTVFVEGEPIPLTEGPAGLEAVGFKEETYWEWRSPCLYVLVDVVADQLSTIEIGAAARSETESSGAEACNSPERPLE